MIPRVTDDTHLFSEKLREWEAYYNYQQAELRTKYLITRGEGRIGLLQASKREAGSRMADPRNFVQLFAEELLVSCSTGYSHFDEIIEIPGQ
jgi:hypothetical protein